MNSSYVVTFAKIPFQMRAHSQVSRVRILTHLFEGHNLTHNRELLKEMG